MKADRVLSLDALRGFDMFWIVGGRPLFLAALGLVCQPLPPAIHAQFEHSDWGPPVTFWDLIMPLFLFMMGAAMTFSFSKRRERGDRYLQIYAKVFSRFLLLWILGSIAGGQLLSFDPQKIKLSGNVLHYIACGYLIGAIALLHLRVLGQLACAFALLLGYCLLMLYAPFPGAEAGTLRPACNLAFWLDSRVLGHYNGFVKAPTVLSSMSLGATVLLGSMAGHILRLPKGPWRKVQLLACAGAAALLAGWLWAYWFPMNKWLWSSSFALWMAGMSYLLLAAFYVAIDIWGFRRLAFPCVVIGSNAILAYMLTNVYGASLSKPLVMGLADHAGAAHDLVLAMGQVGVLWLILWCLYRNRVFLRV